MASLIKFSLINFMCTDIIPQKPNILLSRYSNVFENILKTNKIFETQ